MNIDYSEKIPNNVNLSNDRRLQRALERWQPEYLNWWNDLGPDKGKELEVYLRTAISVEKKAGPISIMSECLNTAGGFFLRPLKKTGRSDLVSILVKMHGRKCRENIVEN